MENKFLKQKYVELYRYIEGLITKSSEITPLDVVGFNIISCFAKSEVSITNKKKKEISETQLIASIQHLDCSLGGLLKVSTIEEEIVEFLFKGEKLLVLIVLPFLAEIEYGASKLKNNNNIEVRVCTINYLLNNIHILYERKINLKGDKKGIKSPIVIFRNFHWSNIVYLLKLSGVVISGGSVTRRHKLSTVEYKLSTFFNLLSAIEEIHLNENMNELIYSSYNNVAMNNQKIDRDSYLYFKGEATHFEHSNEFILDFLSINYYLYLYFSYKSLYDNYLLQVTEINTVEGLLSLVQGDIVKLSYRKDYKQESLGKLAGEKNRTKNKASLSGLIHNLEKELRDKKIKEQSLTGEIIKLKASLIELERKLDKFNMEVEEIKKSKLNTSDSVRSEESNNFDKVEPHNLSEFFKFTPKSLNKNLIGTNIFKRKYHVSSVNNLVVSLPESNLNYKSEESNLIKNSKDYSLDSPMFKELKRILLESPLNENTQLLIESFLKDQASLLFKEKINKEEDLNYNLLNKDIITVLKSSINKLNKLLFNLKENIKYKIKTHKNSDAVRQLNLLNELLTVNNDDIISLMLGRLLRIISNKNLVNNNTIFTNVAIDLGGEIVNKYLHVLYTKSSEFKQEGLNFSLWLELNKNIVEEYQSQVNLFFFGANLINLLIEMDLVVQSLTNLEGLTKVNYLIPGKVLYDKIGDFKVLELPNKIPMVVKPNKYERYVTNGKTVERLGGFLLNDIEFANDLIIKNWELKYHSKIRDINVIYDLVNNVSSVGFKINTQVLNFVINYGVDYNLHIDFNYIHPLAEKQKLTKKEHKELESFISQKKLELNVLGLASLFKDIPEFYIPVRLDTRGRLYCNCDYLNYQSIDLAKSLLLFSKEEKIAISDEIAIKYLKIFGANCFGNGIEKKSFDDRVKWVSDNEINILNFKNGILIKHAESKPLFVSFCFEYLKYYKAVKENKSYFYSGLPIQLDATCNGYQHLALLIGDHSLAEELNLHKSSWFDKPKDFYTFLALNLKEYFEDKVNEILKIKNNEDKDLLESYQRLANLKIQRTLIKKPIMTKPYNVTHYQMINYIKEDFDYKVEDNNSKEIWFEYKKDPTIKLKGKDFQLIGKAIDIIIYKKFPKLYDFSIYLKKIAQICCELNITIPWCLPSGLKIDQFYMDSESFRLKPFVFNKSSFKLNLPNKEKINKNKQIRALMPNLVHSLDASSLALLVDLYFNEDKNKINNFYSVHDCFAVTANNVKDLMNKLKLVYSIIYSNNNYLKTFDLGIKNHIKLQFGITSLDDGNNKITINNVSYEFPDINQVINGKCDYYSKKFEIKNTSNNLVKLNNSVISKEETPYLAS